MSLTKIFAHCYLAGLPSARYAVCNMRGVAAGQFALTLDTTEAGKRLNTFDVVPMRRSVAAGATDKLGWTLEALLKA